MVSSNYNKVLKTMLSHSSFLFQLTSMLMEVVLVSYNPMLLINCRALFSDSYLAQHIDIVSWMVRYFLECMIELFPCLRKSQHFSPVSRALFTSTAFSTEEL